MKRASLFPICGNIPCHQYKRQSGTGTSFSTLFTQAGRELALVMVNTIPDVRERVPRKRGVWPATLRGVPKLDSAKLAVIAQ